MKPEGNEEITVNDYINGCRLFQLASSVFWCNKRLDLPHCCMCMFIRAKKSTEGITDCCSVPIIWGMDVL